MNHCPMHMIFGADVSSTEIVIACAVLSQTMGAKQAVERISNQSQAIKAWLRKLPKDAVIGMEATGRYHVRQLTKQGNAEDRRLIYLAAQSATKTKTFKPLYLALREKGFATTEAIVIIARKYYVLLLLCGKLICLSILINSLLGLVQNHRIYDCWIFLFKNFPTSSYQRRLVSRQVS